MSDSHYPDGLDIDADVSQNLKAADQASNGNLTRLMLMVKESLLGLKIPVPTRKALHRKIAAELNVELTPHIACRHGCSHCCHMAVGISQDEAEEISRRTGRPMRLPYQDQDPDPEVLALMGQTSITKYMGVDCPFLAEDGRCSIYEFRPIACRTHFNLSSHPELCDLSTGCWDTPNLDLTELWASFTLVAYGEKKYPADIREFFPQDSI